MDRQTKIAQAMAALDRIARHLEAERTSVKAQLAAYPAPIPACDAQYNHLAEERRRLTAELARVAAARREILASADPLAALDRFQATSPHLAQAARRAAEAEAASSA